MRPSLRPHVPTFAAFVACLLVASAVALALPPTPQGRPASPALREPIPLPGPGRDADRDSYADAQDLHDGDALLVVDLLALDSGRGAAEPYVLLGTQSDHTRFGAGAELEWRHVVDPDPLGHRAGSRAWRDDAVRTGVWVSTRPHPELERGIAQSPTLEEASPPSGAAWPQRLVLNIRDDRAVVDARVELRDASRRPHAVVAAWDVAVDTTGGTQGTHPLGSNLTLESGGARLRLRLAVEPDLNATAKQGLARKWAPILAFDSEESFHPVPGAALERFHGFSRRPPDLRTWDPGFNNGRDEYRLLLADFDGDGRVDHRDARLMAEVLANGPVGAPTVHAHVMRTHMDEVVVQYWFLYFYNFVVDEAGRDVRTLAHNGDREFIQLRFASLSDALEGRPASVAYSQHYGGVRFLAPQAGDVPFHLDPHHPSVFVSRGSHASYPVAGDDRAGRPAFVGYFDRFDGNGARWGPDDYTLDVLASQSWHMAHLWGPATRHTRELGTSFRPLLQYDFRYPYHDPYDWERDLAVLTPLQALERYGRT